MRVSCIAVMSLAVVAAGPAARAQDGRPIETAAATVEVTPHVSLGSAGSTGFGAAVRWPLGSKLSVEVEAGQRRAEIAALGASASLLYDLPNVGRVTPYVAAGVGVDQYGYASGAPATGLVTQTLTALTVNAGGGVRVPVWDNWGYRADARWFNGLGPKAPERWRLYNGVAIGSGKR